MRQRHVEHEPITPAKDHMPPNFVVACLDCGFSVDAHGLAADDAVLSVSPWHAAGHQLIARAVDYSEHPLYK